MNKQLKINKPFIKKYFSKSTLFQYGFIHDRSINKVIDGMCRLILKIIPEDYPEDVRDIILSLSSLEWAADFVNEYSLPVTCTNDLSFMFHVFTIGNDLLQMYFDKQNTLIELEKLVILMKSFKDNKTTIKSIIFTTNEGSFTIQDHYALRVVEVFLDLSFKRYARSREVTIMTKSSIKSLYTHDLRIFSWALLKYLNIYTQYKSDPKTIASNEQCRIIYRILKDAKYLQRPDDDCEEVNYIRAYLRQASKQFE